MAREGQQIISIYVPLETYEEIKLASKQENTSMKEYLLSLHRSKSSIKSEEQNLLARLERAVSFLENLSDLTPLQTKPGAAPKTKFNVESPPQGKLFDIIQKIKANARTIKQAETMIKIVEIIRDSEPTGVPLSIIRKSTNSSARNNLIRLIDWGIVNLRSNLYHVN